MEFISSILIPAHNEASVITRCLQVLLADAERGEFEICVASNGSGDQTVALAQSILSDWPGCQVLDLPRPSKTQALRAGDRALTTFPRIYLDADVCISTSVARKMAETLSTTDEPRVASPRMVIDDARSSWAVRAYNRVWQQTPYVSAGVIGTGVYALNAQGAKRIDGFPDVLNDDEFVRRSFSQDEREVVAGDFVTTAPLHARALIRRRARVAIGNAELDEHGDAGDDSGMGSMRSLVAGVYAKRIGVIDFLTYAGITVASFALARVRQMRGTAGTWSTDDTSRTVLDSPT